MKTVPVTCSQASLDVGEPLFATAAEGVSLWLLIEYAGQWAPRILDTPCLPDAVRSWIAAFVAAHPGARPQLIRQPGRPHGGRHRCLLVRAGGAEPVAWRLEVDALEELAQIDLEALLARPDARPELRWRRPLFLVCTHGKRDACCAHHGPAVYRALAAERGDEAWCSSHLGGHRFAPTFVCLPHGHMFGRADAPTAQRIARGYAAGRLTDLRHYRGRATYARPVQAAEYFLRHELGSYGIDALRPAGVEVAGEARWRVRLVERDSGDTHELTVNRVASDDLASPSCGLAPVAVRRFVLEAHRQLGPRAAT